MSRALFTIAILAAVLLAASIVHASPAVNLGHYFVRKSTSQSVSFPMTDSGDAAAEDIEGMTFTLQIGNGTGSAPAISVVNFLSGSIWTGYVPAGNIFPAAGAVPQFKSYTLFTTNPGDYVNPNGSLASVTFNAGSAAVGNYTLKMTGTGDPDSDSQFTNGVGDPVSATFAAGLLSVVAPGDFDRNGVVTAADLDEMFTALTNLNAYETLRSVNADGLLAIGDLNNDHAFDNGDLQPMLRLLIQQSGGSQVLAVPEPPAIVLGAISIFGFAAIRSKFRRS